MKAVLKICLFLVCHQHLNVYCQEEKESFLNNLDVDLSQPTYDQILYKILHPEHPEKALESMVDRQKRQVKEFRQLSLPQIEIPFRDMASIVAEAEAAINNRFDVLEPQIYNSNARQVPKSPEWFMSASSKIKVIAKNMTKVALVAEEASKYLAKAYNLTKDEVTFGLPLSDVRGTRLATLCQIKVDFPCQPGKYRAYNGYCNNVQNPNWGNYLSVQKCMMNELQLCFYRSGQSSVFEVPTARLCRWHQCSTATQKWLFFEESARNLSGSTHGFRSTSSPFNGDSCCMGPVFVP